VCYSRKHASLFGVIDEVLIVASVEITNFKWNYFIDGPYIGIHYTLDMGWKNHLFLRCVVIIRPTSDPFVFVLQETVMGKTSHVFFLSWYFLSEFALMDYIHHNCYFNIYIAYYFIFSLASADCVFHVWQVYLPVHWSWGSSLCHFLFWLYCIYDTEWLLPELCILLECLMLWPNIFVVFHKSSANIQKHEFKHLFHLLSLLYVCVCV
jgi:hypothetical protein